VARHDEGQAAVLRQMQSLFQVGALGDLTDGQLLERFMTGPKESAEPAFTALVERHGPMVWRVCRRVLTDADQAQDAFQATFLVLVQQARSVRQRESVASWLYGVAYRVASCARSAESRRRKHEERYAVRQEQGSRTNRYESAEFAQLLDDELCRLPERLRAPIVLCDLEDATHEQAAVRLGWPVGTVKSRLARGREKLRSRLVRRGLAPSLGLAGVVILREPAAAAIPSYLIDSTVQSALGLGAGLSLTSSASAVITLWTSEVSKAMWMTKLRWGAFTVLTVSAVGLGVSFLWRQAEARQQRPSAKSVSSAPATRNQNDDAIWARHLGNLKRIGLALHNYHAAEGHFPPATTTGRDGQPLLSWRVAILPYLQDYDGRSQDDLFKAFHLDEPWDSPHNKALLERMPAVFASSGARSGQPFTTAYRGFVSSSGGPGAGAGMASMMGMMGSGGGPGMITGSGGGAGAMMSAMMGGMASGSAAPGMSANNKLPGMSARSGAGAGGMMGMTRGMMGGPGMGAQSKVAGGMMGSMTEMAGGQPAGASGMMGGLGGAGAMMSGATGGPAELMGMERTRRAQMMRRSTMMPGMGGMMGGMASKKGRDVRNRTPNKTDDEKAEGSGQPDAGAGGQADSQPTFVLGTVFRENRGVDVAEITDGTNYTLMVVEAAEPVPWTKPDELSFSPNGPLPRLGGSLRDGYAALFASGLVRFLDQRIDERLLRCLITANGGEILSTDQVPQADAPPPGGLIAQQDVKPTADSAPTDSQRYSGAGTLENAVGILKDKLKREGKSEIGDWLTVPKARKAIHAGLRTYEKYLRRVGEPEVPRRQFEIVKPIFEQLVSTGSWPSSGWFAASSSTETRDRITYDRYQVRLELEAMDKDNAFRFSMLILDVLTGPVEAQAGPDEAQDRPVEPVAQ
jgi:RNA polymerase sigma factor (sigma-70 family)